MVLFVSYSGAFGGAERLLVDFAGALSSACAVACPEGPLAAAAREAGLRTFPLRTRSLQLRAGPAQRARSLADLTGHALELRRLARALAPELVVAWGMRSALAAPLRGGAALAFQHNDFLPGRAIGAAVRAAAARADLITAPSRAVARDLDPAGRHAERTAVIAPGVDSRRFGDGRPPAVPPEILVLGALTAWKRPDLALEVLARVRAQLPEVRLRLAGAPLPGDDPSLLKALEARAAQPDLAGSVELAGSVSDVAGALARASCLLHCADREPFGIAVLEALAAGRPAVVPDAGGPAEIVDASCGRRFRPGDSAAAAAALVEVLSDPDLAGGLGAAGRVRAARRFARERQRGRYAAALQPFIRHRRAVELDRARELVLITVTHNSDAELTTLLASADRHLPGTPVVVADCASTDATLRVARAHPRTNTLGLANIGFGRACNRAVAAVREPVVALVNPDVELIDDSLLELVSELRRPGSPVRLLAPRVLNPDGSLQDTVHPAPLSPADLTRAFVPPAVLPGRLGEPLAPWRARHPRRVGWAVGCALLAATDTLRALGPFSERIFLYGEDMELGLRAARQGIETWLWPAGRLIHHGGHSIEVAHGGEPYEMRARARHTAVALARGNRAARLDDLQQAFTFGSRAALKRALGRPAERERRQLAAVRRVPRG